MVEKIQNEWVQQLRYLDTALTPVFTTQVTSGLCGKSVGRRSFGGAELHHDQTFTGKGDFSAVKLAALEHHPLLMYLQLIWELFEHTECLPLLTTARTYLITSQIRKEESIAFELLK